MWLEIEEDAQGSPRLGHFPSTALSQLFLMNMSNLILAGYLSRVSSHSLEKHLLRHFGLILPRAVKVNRFFLDILNFKKKYLSPEGAKQTSLCGGGKRMIFTL